MKISTKGRYALRMMLDLAEHEKDTYVPLRDISARQNISMKYLEQITATLCKVGFLKSIRGPQGGYRLARDPKDYKVGEILRTTDGDLAPVACLVNETIDCPRSSECSTLSFWKGLQQTIDNYIDSYSLSDLIKKI